MIRNKKKKYFIFDWKNRILKNKVLFSVVIISYALCYYLFLFAENKIFFPYTIVGNAVFLLIIYILAFNLLRYSLIRRKNSSKNKYFLLAMWIFYIAYSVLFVRLMNFPDWLPLSLLLPTALIVMMVSVLINPRTAITFSIFLSLSLFIIKMDPYVFIYALLSGISGTLAIVGTKKRIDLIRASTAIAAINAGIFIMIGLFKNLEPALFPVVAGIGAANGFVCGILNLGLLPFFEHFLNAPTRFRLMELSDINSPILKRMLTLAPGTYGHSLNVANLAESACTEIKANALLARVGGYYHDIGKIDQAQYFIENQNDINKHDELKPSLSISIIKSHVKIGVEKAREIGLPSEVIEIIAQHHGNGLISFFFQKALKKNKNVSPEDFSYSESPPTTKEAAVVMLADTIEAASRTLKKPNITKLESFIWDIFVQRLTTGQLNDCDLTFKDLKKIKKAFVQILAGHFHSRIDYPVIKESLR